MKYITILLCLLFLSFYIERKFRIHLYQSRLERIIIPFFFFIFGTVWDSYAVFNGDWSFNYQNLVGIKIGLLPLEEYLFFMIVPYFILTLYRLLQKKIK